MPCPAAASSSTPQHAPHAAHFNAPEKIEDSLRTIDELGGPTTFNHYPWGWTWAGNTPFRRWKRETYRGGASDPFLVHWPRGIKARGEVRTQYAHLVDMVPTVLDVLGIEPPDTIKGVTQSPLHGVSFAHTFDNPTVPTLHHTQYFEMLGHRAIDHDGWRAVCPWPGPSFTEARQPFGTPISSETLSQLDARSWELFHIDEDFAETRDIAADHRDKLIEMVSLWYVEAGKYGVLLIDGSALARMIVERPQITKERTSYAFRPGTQTLPASVVPRVLNRPHSITADAEIPTGGAEGLLMSQGSMAGGWSFYIKDGTLTYVHNYVSRALYTVASPDPVPADRHELRFEFEPTGKPDLATGKGAPGRAQLYIDRRLVARSRFPGDHPHHVQPRRPDLRRQPRPTGHSRLPGTVPVHRKAAQRDRRRVGRAHHRRGQGDAHAHGPAVNRRLGPRTNSASVKMELADRDRKADPASSKEIPPACSATWRRRPLFSNPATPRAFWSTKTCGQRSWAQQGAAGQPEAAPAPPPPAQSADDTNSTMAQLKELGELPKGCSPMRSSRNGSAGFSAPDRTLRRGALGRRTRRAREGRTDTAQGHRRCRRTGADRSAR